MGLGTLMEVVLSKCEVAFLKHGLSEAVLKPKSDLTESSPPFQSSIEGHPPETSASSGRGSCKAGQPNVLHGLYQLLRKKINDGAADVYQY